MHPRIASKGRPLENPHLVDTFCANHFLVSPEGSGRRCTLQSANNIGTATVKETPVGESGRFFSIESLPPCWVPFGGGAAMCLGRVFTKNAMLASFNMLSIEFDVEPI